MQKISLKIKDKEKNSVTTEQFEIEEVNLRQVTKTIKIVKDVIGLAQEDEDLKGLLSELFDSAEQQVVKGAKTEAETEEEFGQNITQHLTGAIDVLLMEIPDKVVELLAVLSDIEVDTLMEQKAEEVLDVYDAIIQVNDIDKLIARGKKSLKLTKSQVKVMNIFQPKVVETPAKKKTPAKTKQA